MPPASPWPFLVHASSCSPLSHCSWPGDFSWHPSGQVNHWHPTGLQLVRKEFTEMEEALLCLQEWQRSHRVLGNPGASSVFFQLPVNQSP